MSTSTVVVTLQADQDARSIFSSVLGDVADIIFLTDLESTERAAALGGATVIIARNTGKELRAGEDDLIGRCRLLQFVTAGVDYIPLRQLPGMDDAAARKYWLTEHGPIVRRGAQAVGTTGSLPAGIASSRAATSTNEATPPHSSASRIARGTLTPASLVSSEMSPADSNP